jgi:hypothetical protein
VQLCALLSLPHGPRAGSLRRNPADGPFRFPGACVLHNANENPQNARWNNDFPPTGHRPCPGPEAEPNVFSDSPAAACKRRWIDPRQESPESGESPFCRQRWFSDLLPDLLDAQEAPGCQTHRQRQHEPVTSGPDGLSTAAAPSVWLTFPCSNAASRRISRNTPQSRGQIPQHERPDESMASSNCAYPRHKVKSPTTPRYSAHAPTQSCPHRPRDARSASRLTPSRSKGLSLARSPRSCESAVRAALR